MSETQAPEAPEAHEGHHPTPRQYVQIAVVLAVLTALEVSTFFVDLEPAAVPLLLVLMVLKFALVVGWYMHLRFDTRLFTRLMVAGLLLAVAVYGVTLATFVNTSSTG